MSQKHNAFTRRHFLGRCNRLALGSTCALSALTRLQLTQAQVAQPSDYKALVCVFLFGGNDAFNMIVPRDADTYASYAATRQDLAVSREDVIALGSSQQGGREFGLHPALADLAQLYNTGKMAVLANVGALIEPTSKSAYQTKAVAVPPQLFSHNDQQNFVQSLQSTQRRNGWAGRAAEVLSEFNRNPNLSMNISLSGSNLWQSAGALTPYSISSDGIGTIRHMERDVNPVAGSDSFHWDSRVQSRIQTMEAMLAQEQDHVLARAYGKSLAKSWDLADEVGLALQSVPALHTSFPSDNPLAASLQMTAKLISARSALGAGRQTFFIGMGDFDTHGDQVRRHDLLMAQLNDALKAFYDSTLELGLANQITTFTMSDFGRTLTSNGDGTDHGWGSHQLIMGGAVKGGEIFGTMPDLTIGSNDDMGEGRIIPTTSIDQYGASLAAWFGLSSGANEDVFPNLKNFDIKNLNLLLS